MKFSSSALFSALCLTFMLAGVSKGDDFAAIPLGDPIYAQLSVLTRAGNTGKTARPAKDLSITRYEAALETARVIFSVTEDNRTTTTFSRSRWRALRDLIVSLRPELRKMDVDTTAVLALTERALRTEPAISLPAPAPSLIARTRIGRGEDTSPAALARPALTRAGGLLNTLGPLRQPDLRIGSLQVPLSQRLRVETALLALQRETNDPFGDTARMRPTVALPMGSQTVGAGSSLTYNLNSWLSLRGNYGRRNLNMGVPALRALEAPFFGGASQTRSAGGGVDVSLGSNLRFSTDLERLATDTGARGTRLGGGIGLSAWQNRLSLSAHLSRLVPEDSAALASTATELNVGVDVTRRLSLNLLYQSLFTEQNANSASRVGGGISLSF